ncbi:MAG: hypothetical protein ACK443_09730 [Methylococcaceae bacterium]
MIEFIFFELPVAVCLYVAFAFFLQRHLLTGRTESPIRPVDHRTIADVESCPSTSDNHQPLVAELMVSPYVQVDLPVEPDGCGEHVPTDSVLRRHFISQLSCRVADVLGPAPTDSILKRHYDHLLETETSACLLDEHHLARLCAVTAEAGHDQTDAGNGGDSLDQGRASECQHAPDLSAIETPVSGYHLPEDAVLRRHNLSQLLYRLDAIHGDWPTDSVLIRHRTQLMAAELKDCLRDPGRLEGL